MNSDIYNIGSFNMCKFARQSGSETKKSYDVIARIICDAKFDIVAMQEVFNKEAVRELVYVLNRKSPSSWDYAWEEPKKTINKQAREGYAFVWRKDRLDKVSVRLDNGSVRIFEPRILNQYKKSLVKLGKGALIRNPYYGRFAPRNASGESYGFELRLINTHIMYSSSVVDSEYSSYSDVLMRKREYSLLSHVVLTKIDSKQYGTEEEDNCGVKTHLNAYTFLLGDYNLNLRSVHEKNPAPFIPICEEIEELADFFDLEEHKIVTIQDEKTTFHRKGENINENDNIQSLDVNDDSVVGSAVETLKTSEKSIYKSNYDHFTFDQKRIQRYTTIPEAHRINAVENNSIGVDLPTVSYEFQGDYQEYISKVSDHLPIIMKLQINPRRK